MRRSAEVQARDGTAGRVIPKFWLDYVFAQTHLFSMRIVRIAIATLVTMGLTLSPVAAGLAQAHMVKCERMMMTQHDGCSCCGDVAKCPPTSCVAKCFGSQMGLTDDSQLPQPERQKLNVGPSAIVWSLAFSPDPPPPRF